MASDWTISLGAILAEDLKEMKISQKQLADQIGVPKSTINEIIKGKRKMPLEIAVKLEAVLGAPAEYWMKLQTDCEIEKKKSEKKYHVTADGVIKKGNYSATEIAHWFINRAAKDANENIGEYMTQLKLQKLLYLVQERSLKIDNNGVHCAIFADPILHWEYGPVVRSVYDEYKHFGHDSLSSAPETHIDRDTQRLLESVYKFYHSYSASGLVTVTHQRQSWKTTGNGEEMTLEMLLED